MDIFKYSDDIYGEIKLFWLCCACCYALIAGLQ
jgi:hypothetical protein